MTAQNLLIDRVTSQYNLAPKENNDGVSTEKLSDVDGTSIDISMYMVSPTINNPYYYAELEWRYHIERGQYYSSEPSSPLDSIGFAWLDSCWETATYNLDTSSASSDYVTTEDSAFGAGTFGFSVDDKAIGQEYNCIAPCSGYTDYYWGGVYLSSENHPDCYNDSDTKVLGVYDHTWSGTHSSFGISASFPASIGISYTTESYVDNESTTTEDDGDTALVVTQDDAS